MAVCPAGEDVLGPYLQDKPNFIEEHLRVLQKKVETIYVVDRSDAQEHVEKRFPHKKISKVSGIRPTSIRGFLSGMKIIFQSGQAKGIDAVYHFIFTGTEPCQATVTIRQQRLEVQAGLQGAADCTITADSDTWLGFLRKEKSLIWALILRRIKVRAHSACYRRSGDAFRPDRRPGFSSADRPVV